MALCAGRYVGMYVIICIVMYIGSHLVMYGVT